MERLFSNDTLTVKPEGKVDTSNAAEVEKEIFAFVDEYKPAKVIIDAQKLKYISSAGLRVILKLKKTVDDSIIINASLEVYDILDMTGFTNLIDVKKAFREVSVEGCEMIGKGGHGTVYRLDGDTIVKLYGENEPFDEIEREVSYSKKAFVYGIPDSNKFVHGDIHPKNIMLQDGKLLFIDMADLTYGHSIFDYAGIALTHILAKAYTKQLFGVEPDIMEKLFNNMIKANFQGRSEEELEKTKKVIMGYAGIKYAISPAVNKNQDPKFCEGIVNRAREQILPNAKSLIGAIDF